MLLRGFGLLLRRPQLAVSRREVGFELVQLRLQRLDLLLDCLNLCIGLATAGGTCKMPPIAAADSNAHLKQVALVIDSSDPVGGASRCGAESLRV